MKNDGNQRVQNQKGISQAQLAKLMETTQAAVAMWETGARMPRADKLPKLAEVLGCSVADLFANQKRRKEVPPWGG